jgi:transcriptional regulator with XRE-family HTH domain
VNKIRSNKLTPQQETRLKQIFKQQGPQYKSAARLGISTSHVSKIVASGFSPSKLLLEKILTEFNINPDWFYHDHGSQTGRVEEMTQELTDLFEIMKSRWPGLPMAKRYELAGKIMGLISLEDPPPSDRA